MRPRYGRRTPRRSRPTRAPGEARSRSCRRHAVLAGGAAAASSPACVSGTLPSAGMGGEGLGVIPDRPRRARAPGRISGATDSPCRSRDRQSPRARAPRRRARRARRPALRHELRAPSANAAAACARSGRACATPAAEQPLRRDAAEDSERQQRGPLVRVGGVEVVAQRRRGPRRGRAPTARPRRPSAAGSRRPSPRRRRERVAVAHANGSTLSASLARAIAASATTRRRGGAWGVCLWWDGRRRGGAAARQPRLGVDKLRPVRDLPYLAVPVESALKPQALSGTYAPKFLVLSLLRD